MKGKDDFDFSLRSGKTPSSGTGPHADNTLKNKKGNYIQFYNINNYINNNDNNNIDSDSTNTKG